MSDQDKVSGASVVPPHDFDAEEATLGAMLLSSAAIAEVGEVVEASDFYKPSHAHIFSAILTCSDEGSAADSVTVHAKLVALGLAEEIKASDLISLTANVPAISSVRHYAGIVAEAARKRRLAGVGNELRSEALDPTMHSTAVVEQLEARLVEVAGDREPGGGPSTSAEVLDLVIGRITQAQIDGGDVGGIRTGHVDLDRLLGPFEPETFAVVGADTSMGKTAFALGLLRHAAAHGTPTLLFSAEMSKQAIFARHLAATACVSTDRQKSRDLTDAELGRLFAESDRLAKLPLVTDDKGAPSVAYVRRVAKAQQVRAGLGLVVIDYLQLLSGPERAENRHRELSSIVAALKGMAKDLGVVVVLLSQTNRNNASRADKRPMLIDLRDSGTIEEAADVVMFLYRDDYYNPESTDKGLAEVIVAKNRNGPTGTIKLTWLGEFARFADHAWQGDRL